MGGVTDTLWPSLTYHALFYIHKTVSLKPPTHQSNKNWIQPKNWRISGCMMLVYITFQLVFNLFWQQLTQLVPSNNRRGWNSQHPHFYFPEFTRLAESSFLLHLNMNERKAFSSSKGNKYSVPENIKDFSHIWEVF